MDGAPLEAAGAEPIPADLENGAAAPFPAPVPFLVPEHLMAVGQGRDGRGGDHNDDEDFEPPTTKYIPYVTDPPPTPPSR